jgi:hypothetical protein
MHTVTSALYFLGRCAQRVFLKEIHADRWKLNLSRVTLQRHVGFVEDRVALEKVSFKYSVSPNSPHSTKCSIHIYHPGMVQ